MPSSKSFKTAVQGADKLFSANDTSVSAPSEPLKELKINQTFKDLIPPLSDEEYSQLEANLLEHGIREPLSVWGEIIVDGHNRYELATKHNLPFAIVNYNFSSERDAIMWIIHNQFGRRNLSSWHRSNLALKFKPIIAEKAKERQIASGGAAPQKSVEPPIDTQKEIAAIAGVSHDTIARVEKILQTGTPETIEKLDRREISINEAYKDTRSQARKLNAASPTITPVPVIKLDNQFNIIYVDPSWAEAVSFEDVKKMQIPTEDDAILFLWTSSPDLEKALRLMNAWGFKYKTNLIWDKTESGLELFIYGQHDVLLIGIKGKFSLPPDDVRISSVYRKEKGDHTEKPQWFYEQIENVYPGGKYLELFATHSFSSNWTVWENQINSEEEEE